MSYARFGAGGSTVYVFVATGGWLECCACALTQLGDHVEFKTTAGMISHLNEHRDAGHTVLQETIDDLLRDAEDNDQWIKEHRHGR